MQLHKALFIAMIGLFTSAVDAQSAAMPDVTAFAVGDRWSGASSTTARSLKSRADQS